MKSFILLSLLTSISGLSSIPPSAPNTKIGSTSDYFASPSTTGAMAPMTIAKDPMAPLGKQWTSQMDRKVEHGVREDGSPIKFYGEENQTNGHGGRGPLGKEWTSAMDIKVQKSTPQELHFKPYGLDHQANGRGGRSPLGKEWTTSMDSKPRKQGF